MKLVTQQKLDVIDTMRADHKTVFESGYESFEEVSKDEDERQDALGAVEDFIDEALWALRDLVKKGKL